MIATLTLNPAVDKNTRVERVIAEDKLRCDAPTREPGGGGINVSRVIHRLDGSAQTLYTAGGFTGSLLNDLLDAEDLNHTPIATEAMTRENMIVYETSTDRQFRFGMPGPELTEAELDDCLNALRTVDPAPDYVVASGSLPPGLPDEIGRAHV